MSASEFARAWAEDDGFVDLAKSLFGDEASVADVADVYLGENNPISKAFDPGKHLRDAYGRWKSKGDGSIPLGTRGDRDFLGHPEMFMNDDGSFITDATYSDLSGTKYKITGDPSQPGNIQAQGQDGEYHTYDPTGGKDIEGASAEYNQRWRNWRNKNVSKLWSPDKHKRDLAGRFASMSDAQLKSHLEGRAKAEGAAVSAGYLGGYGAWIAGHSLQQEFLRKAESSAIAGEQLHDAMIREANSIWRMRGSTSGITAEDRQIIEEMAGKWRQHSDDAVKYFKYATRIGKPGLVGLGVGATGIGAAVAINRGPGSKLAVKEIRARRGRKAAETRQRNKGLQDLAREQGREDLVKAWTPDKHPRDTSGKFRPTDMLFLAAAGAGIALGGRYAGRAYEAGRLARELNTKAKTAKEAAEYTGNIAHAVENAGKKLGDLKIEDLTKHVEDLKAAGVAYTDEQAQALLEAPASAKAFEELTTEHAKVFANASEHQKGLVTEFLKKRNAALRSLVGNALKGTVAGSASASIMEALKAKREVRKDFQTNLHPRDAMGKFAEKMGESEVLNNAALMGAFGVGAVGTYMLGVHGAQAAQAMMYSLKAAKNAKESAEALDHLGPLEERAHNLGDTALLDNLEDTRAQAAGTALWNEADAALERGQAKISGAKAAVGAVLTTPLVEEANRQGKIRNTKTGQIIPTNKRTAKKIKKAYEAAVAKGMSEEQAAKIALSSVSKIQGKLLGYGLLAAGGLSNAAGIGTGIHADKVKRAGGTLPYRPLLGAGAGVSSVLSAGQGLAEIGGAVLEGSHGGAAGAGILATAGVGDLLGAYGLGKYYMAQEDQAHDTGRHMVRDAAQTGVNAFDTYQNTGSIKSAGKEAAGAPSDYHSNEKPVKTPSGGHFGAIKEGIKHAADAVNPANNKAGPHRPPLVHQALSAAEGAGSDWQATPNHWDDWFAKHPEKKDEYKQGVGKALISKGLIPHPVGSTEWLAAYDKIASAANEVYDGINSGKITAHTITPSQVDAVRNGMHNVVTFEVADAKKGLYRITGGEPQVEGSDWAFATHPEHGFGNYEYPHPDQAKMTFHFWDKNNIRRDSKGRFTFSDGVQKSHDVVWEGEISKIDDDKRQVFGWASVTQLDGKDIVDRQGDYITPDEMEKAAYNYVMTSRVGGDMHKRVTKGENDSPHHASDMIESFVVTPEKLSKMGLPSDSLPTGWWVGFKVNDENVWQSVKKGERKAFSIHGRGKRIEKSADSINKAMTQEEEAAREIFCKIFYLAEPHERVELLQMAGINGVNDN